MLFDLRQRAVSLNLRKGYMLTLWTLCLALYHHLVAACLKYRAGY